MAKNIGSIINTTSDLMTKLNETNTVHIPELIAPIQKIDKPELEKVKEKFSPFRPIEKKQIDQTHSDPRVKIKVNVKNCNHPVTVTNTVTLKR